jgi:hypothetical protein
MYQRSLSSQPFCAFLIASMRIRPTKEDLGSCEVERFDSYLEHEVSLSIRKQSISTAPYTEWKGTNLCHLWLQRQEKQPHL